MREPKTKQDEFKKVLELGINPLQLMRLKLILDLNTHRGGGVSGCFPYVCFFNHSCIPNCQIKLDSNLKMIVESKQPIEKGEELTISYVQLEENETEETKKQQECEKFPTLICFH